MCEVAERDEWSTSGQLADSIRRRLKLSVEFASVEMKAMEPVQLADTVRVLPRRGQAPKESCSCRTTGTCALYFFFNMKKEVYSVPLSCTCNFLRSDKLASVADRPLPE